MLIIHWYVVLQCLVWKIKYCIQFMFSTYMYMYWVYRKSSFYVHMMIHVCIEHAQWGSQRGCIPTYTCNCKKEYFKLKFLIFLNLCQLFPDSHSLAVNYVPFINLGSASNVIKTFCWFDLKYHLYWPYVNYVRETSLQIQWKL